MTNKTNTTEQCTAFSQSNGRDVTAEPVVDVTLLGPPKRKKPDWVTEEGFAFIGAWGSREGIIREGVLWWHDDEPIWEFAHSEELVKDIKDLGCNSIIVHFDYRRGLHQQREEMERTRKLIGLCHKYDLRAGCYFRPDWIFHEALEGEERKLLEHTQRDSHGNRIYLNAGAVEVLCFQHSEVVEDLKKMILIAVQELKADIIHIDGYLFGGMESAYACRCEKCRENFKMFLKERYYSDPDLARKRFGFSRVDHIEPPTEDAFSRVPSGAVMDPVWQEWIRFRCLTTAKLSKHLCEFIYDLNPDVAVEVNSALPTRENMALAWGVDWPTMAVQTDAQWCEDAYFAQILPTGEVISRIRQIKSARAVDNVLFVYTDTPSSKDRDVLRNMAQNAAFNAGTIACLGFVPRIPWDYRKSYAAKQAFMKWLNEHRDIFDGTESAADVAVWRSQKSGAFGSPLVSAAAMRIEQLLIEERIGFDIVYDSWLENPGNHGALLLPNVECVTDEDAERIARFVQNGGGLLVGQETSLYDGWRRKRDDFLLRPLMAPGAGIETELSKAIFMSLGPAGMLTGCEKGKKVGGVSLSRFGKGCVAYVPEIVDPAGQPSPVNSDGKIDFSLDHTNWRVPEKREDVLSALRWILGERQKFRVSAPRGVVAEYLFQPSKNRYIVHLVSFLEPGDVPIINVRMMTEGRKVSSVTAYSPDAGGVPEIIWDSGDQYLSTTILNLDLYCVLSIELTELY